jgi:shikimate dehydrogenase
LADSRKVALFGWPVAHSLSPAMHNAAFRALGLDWRYVLLPVPPEQLKTGLAGLLSGEHEGANVTVPHKSAVMDYLDEIDEAAGAIGAVNTIAVRGKRLIGYNTDAPGFLRALHDAGLEPSGRCALVLGAGGAARSVAFALAEAGCAVTIYNRTVRRAEALAGHLQGLELSGPAVSVPGEAALRTLDLNRFDLLVNATTVGMWPDCEDSPWPDGLSIPSRWKVFDLVYNPLETRLLREARRAGARAIDGLGMLVWQGALAFELWTGEAPPVSLMRAAALEALGSDALVQE